MTAWNGTSQQFSAALQRLICKHGDGNDWQIVQDVLSAALNANEIRSQMTRLEGMVGQATESTNESKRMRNEMDALEAEVKRLAEKVGRKP